MGRGKAPGAQQPSHDEIPAFDLSEAYLQHGRELFLFARNAVSDAGTAEEITQETFTKAWRSQERFDGRYGSVRTWLFAIARNVIKDAYRRSARIPEPTPNPADGIGASEPSRIHDRLELIEALAQLSIEQRQAVVAVHVLGWSYAELSESVNVPVSTLRSRTFHGLSALRRLMEEADHA
ncbi:RNA polymerase sigma factor [Nesterenkonia sp. NBAIMH1]|uniref:RNA polymerase sigma factor n=1 Tax=Nesterenkonia sp. NBAIMH1 TaxID=2600320 RepID=UPI0011B5B373|nr:RNA polymerase sigma factor [Nesterenkonia sp. NBAIMH1]